MKKIKIILLLLLIVGFINLISIKVTEVNAQAISCITNTNSCPDSRYIKLTEALRTSQLKFVGNTTQTMFNASVVDTYKGIDQYSNLCISKNVDQIMKVEYPTGIGAGDPQDNLVPKNTAVIVGGYTVYRYCPDRRNVLKAAKQPQNQEIWGCCPSGYTYALSKSVITKPGFSFYGSQPGQSACCKDISANHTEGDSGYPISYDGTNCFEDVNQTKQVNYAGVSDPIITTRAIGDPLGIASKYIVASSQDNPKQICSANSACALIQDPALNSAITLGATEQYINATATLKQSTVNVFAYKSSEGTGFVINAKQLPNANAVTVCSQCFSADDQIAISADQKSAFLCNADGSVRVEPYKGGSSSSSGGPVNGTDACSSQTDAANKASCLTCVSRGGLWVAIGCVDPSPLGIITGLIRISFGIMSGVALIQLIRAGIHYQTGDEANIKKAREEVVATIIGIAVLAFSVLILRILGVNILDVLPAGSV